MEGARSRRIDTAHELLRGFGSLSVPELLALLSADFHYQVLPESLGMPPRDKEAFAQHAAGIFAVFEEFQMIPKSIVDDVSGDMVVVLARMQGTLKGGGGEWANECVMMIQLSHDGTKVVEVKEFVDSAKALEMARKHAPDDFGCNDPSSSLSNDELSTITFYSTILSFGYRFSWVIAGIALLWLLAL
ncbi:hypothetical protein F5B20DRAFT_597389 [Whalleya microplaca]|nr:hypothetical protein F5B20DRAFT_597389 [Whalleya microplaca]